MVKVTVRFDGKVLVPDQEVDLPTGVPLRATIEEGTNGDTVDSILSLVGLGSEAWKGIDPLDYQNREREGWE